MTGPKCLLMVTMHYVQQLGNKYVMMANNAHKQEIAAGTSDFVQVGDAVHRTPFARNQR